MSAASLPPMSKVISNSPTILGSLPEIFQKSTSIAFKPSLDPHFAAQRYVEEIRAYFHLKDGEIPAFDVIHQGMGPDCHTASLFPGEPLIHDRAHIAAAVFAEKFKQWRITLLPAALIAARHTAMLVTGADKAEAVRSVFHGPYDPLHCPAQLVARNAPDLVWFFDQAAAVYAK